MEGEWWPSKVGLSPTTVGGYEILLRVHMLPAFGSKQLQKVTPTDVGDAVVEALRRGNEQVAANIHRLCHTIFAAAVKSGAVGRNPVEALTCPRVLRREMATLTPKEVWEALDYLAAQGSWDVTPLALMVSTGLRRSELVSLRWGDLDLERSLLRIQRAVHHLKGGEMVVRPPKTTRSRRSVALDPDSLEMLKEHRRECERAAEMFGRMLTDRDWMFAPARECGKGEDGQPWRGDAYSQLLRRTARRLGIRARLHDLRHTQASLMLAAGVNARLVSARLGYSTVGFTLDTYAHLLPGAGAEAAEKMAAILGNGRRPKALPAA